MSFALILLGYLTYYAMESRWKDLIASWISSTMNEYYTDYLNEAELVATDLLERLNNLDEMHMTLGCCGSSGYQDWQNVTKDIPLDEMRWKSVSHAWLLTHIKKNAEFLVLFQVSCLPTGEKYDHKCCSLLLLQVDGAVAG